MAIRKILILVPFVIILFLLQSYLWVPSYEQQTRGNPERLNEYINASIGDATTLNPILSADVASSTIESLVFEGLIDRDEELKFRGRLATSWDLFEEAYFFLNEKALIPHEGVLRPEEIVDLIKERRNGVISSDPEIRVTLENIRDISIIPPEVYSTTRHERTKEGSVEKKIRIKVRAPCRIKLTLKRVDQDLFKALMRILGKDYFSSFPSARYMEFDQDLNEEARAAYAMEILPPTEHNPIILFHLRPGVKFHDGEIFDAKDVKFTYDAIMDPKNLSPRTPDYEPVKEVVVVDPLTVRIVYKRRYSPALGTWAMGILPEHLLNRKALRREAKQRGKDPEKFTLRQSRLNRHPIGCGPFVFREWKSDRFISLDRFDQYWEGAPNYKQYIYRVIPDLLTQEMEYYAGTIDSYSVLPHQVERLENDPQYQAFSGLSFGYTYIGYNMRRAPFNDRRVRKALGMAINVDKIIKYILYGQGERITGPFVKQTDYYNHAIKPLPYNPEGALALLEEAGWKRNKNGWLMKDGKRLEFTLITNSGNDLRKAILTVAQDAWKKIGVDVRTDLIEWSVFIQERVDKGDFDALILGWSMDIEPDLYQIWHSSQTHPHQLNFVGFRNKEADDLIIKIRQEYDHDRQVKYCHRLHEIIAEEQPYTFLYVGKWTAVLDRRIVIQDVDEAGNKVYKKITPTKTGDYTFHFKKWIKLPQAPNFEMGG